MSDTEKNKTLPVAKSDKTGFEGRNRRKSTVIALVMAGMFVLTACSDQQQASIGQCETSRPKLAAIDEVIGGDLAAFTVRDEPEIMPSLSFKDRMGKEISTAEFSGKLVLFNLWATWCAPCREEMPALDALQNELGGENFQVVPVSIDRSSPEKPLAFYNETNLTNLPFYQDDTMGIFNILKKQSLVFGLPATLLIDDNGCILGALNGPAHWAGEDAKALIQAAM